MDPNAVGRINSPFHGVVVSVTANGVVVKSEKGAGGASRSRTVSFTIKPEAAIVRDGKTCSLKELQKGDAISVTFNTKQGSSQHHVTKVVVGKDD